MQIVFENANNKGFKQSVFSVCTFESGVQVPRRATGTIPGDSTNDLGPVTHQVSNDGMCGLRQITGYDDFDWSRVNTRTSSSRTGPTADNTNGEGETTDMKSREITCTIPAFFHCPYRFSWACFDLALSSFNCGRCDE